MNLAEIFCPNPGCPARGRRNEENITVHSQVEQRCYCQVCQQSFSITKGTIFYRLKTDPVQVMLVIALLAHGCPRQAIVTVFGCNEERSKTGGTGPERIVKLSTNIRWNSASLTWGKSRPMRSKPKCKGVGSGWFRPGCGWAGSSARVGTKP